MPILWMHNTMFLSLALLFLYKVKGLKHMIHFSYNEKILFSLPLYQNTTSLIKSEAIFSGKSKLFCILSHTSLEM